MTKLLAVLAASIAATLAATVAASPLLAAECAPGARQSPVAAECQPPPQRASEPLRIAVGKMLYSAAGSPIAAVYKLTAAGNPLIIFDGRPVVVPAGTLSLAGGRLITTLSPAELRRPVRR